jgi:hypothetical protein
MFPMPEIKCTTFRQGFIYSHEKNMAGYWALIILSKDRFLGA